MVFLAAELMQTILDHHDFSTAPVVDQLVHVHLTVVN